MSTGTIEYFRPEHLHEGEWTGEPTARACGFDISMDEVGRRYAELGVGITVRHEGRIIACMGVVRLWKGVGEAWVFTAPGADRFPLLLCRAGLWGLGQALGLLGLHRVQAHVLMDFKPGLRWARYMGFSQEGVCLSYTADGQDVARFARFA
jgi:hypothetical protein